MDYRDCLQKATHDHFWFKSKRGLIDILLSKTISKKNVKILDIGAGVGDDLEVINKHGSIYVVDCCQEALDLIPSSLVKEKVLGDARRLPYKDKFFDIVVAFDVLEHIIDDAAAVAEIERVLKPGGAFVFTLPAYQFLFSSHDRYLGHVRRYNKKMVNALLKNFNKIALGHWLFFLFPCVAFLRLFTRNGAIKENYQKPPLKFINSLIYTILCFENVLIKKGVSLPWGLTVFGIYHSKI